MKFETIKLQHSIIPIKDIKKKSEDFYNLIKKRRSMELESYGL